MTPSNPARSKSKADVQGRGATSFAFDSNRRALSRALSLVDAAINEESK